MVQKFSARGDGFAGAASAFASSGNLASRLSAEAVSVITFAGSSEEIASTCHAHPTLSEAVREAALAVDGRSIHS